MTKLDLRDFIIPTQITNVDETFLDSENPEFTTTDKLWIPADDDNIKATDWAVALGVQNNTVCIFWEPEEENLNAEYWLRHAWDGRRVRYVEGSLGFEEAFVVPTIGKGVLPRMNLDLKKVLDAKRKYCNFAKVVKEKIIEFGEYPGRIVTGEKVPENLVLTGKHYSVPSTKCVRGGCEDLKYSSKYAYIKEEYNEQLADQWAEITQQNRERFADFYEEYECNGKRYVKLDKIEAEPQSSILFNTTESELVGSFWYSNLQPRNTGVSEWFEVQPLTWKILNWKDMPTEINPMGNGSAKVIELESEKVITCSPFTFGDPKMSNILNISMWQNSVPRAWLNGISTINIQENGSAKWNSLGGGDFTGIGFINEAFSNMEFLPISQQETKKEEEKLRKARIISKYIDSVKETRPIIV